MSNEAFEKWWISLPINETRTMSLRRKTWQAAQAELQPEIDLLNEIGQELESVEYKGSYADGIRRLKEINQVLDGYVSYEKECIKLRDELEVSNEHFHGIKNVLHSTQAELSASRAMCDAAVIADRKSVV